MDTEPAAQAPPEQIAGEPRTAFHDICIAHSLRRHLAVAGGPLVVPDARRHPLVHDDPVLRDLGVLACLRAPLLAPGGHAVGSVCAADRVPRA